MKIPKDSKNFSRMRFCGKTFLFPLARSRKKPYVLKVRKDGTEYFKPISYKAIENYIRNFDEKK